MAINPFHATVTDMVSFAREAEERGADAVWVADHFSGSVVGRAWSRDPFVFLGAVAAVTDRVDLGVLVANVSNRHPAQLASAVNSLQSLAPGRVRLGLGSGAAPGSRFAVEHDAIATRLGDAAERRRRLVETIGALRAIWVGAADFDAEVDGVGFSGMSAVVDSAPIPPLIVGASSWPTAEVALTVADGLNLRRTPGLADLLDRVMARREATFEVSVLDSLDDVIGEPARLERYAAAGVDRLVLGVSPPHTADRLVGIAFPDR